MSKKYVVGLLVLFAVIATSASFAFWAGDLLGDNEGDTVSVTIGEADDLTTTVTLTATGDQERTLVPDGYVDGSTTFHTNEFTFNVEWDVDGTNPAYDGAAGTLNVTIESLNLGTLTQSEIEGMFTITITPNNTAITEGGSAVSVTVTVYFENEPVDQSMYNEVANGELDIELLFTVTVD